MKVCVYDNPATMRREAWIDGFMHSSAAMSLIESKGFKISDISGKVAWIIHDGPFNPGEIDGDPEALKERNEKQ